MTSEDGSDALDLTGSISPDAVTTPPLQHQGASMENPLVAALIDDKPPISGDPAEEALRTPAPEPKPEQDSTPLKPEATADDEAGQASVEDGKPADQTVPDPYFKQLSQQLTTLANQVGELKGQIGQQQNAVEQNPEASAEEQAELQQAQDDLGNALEEMAALEKALEDRDEFEGVEPKDLKAVIKAMGGLVKRVQAAEARASQAEQAAQSSAQQSSVQAFFDAESKAHGVDAKALWTQASDDAVKYLGDHKPGTPGYDLARTYASTRYGELVQQAKTQSTATPDPSPAPAPVKPKAPAPAGNQPRQDPRGTVTQPAGARPAAVSGKRDTKEIIANLIKP